jgi:hypothetical protein
MFEGFHGVEMVYAAESGALLMMVGCLSMFQNGEEYEDASERHLCRKLVTDVPANTFLCEVTPYLGPCLVVFQSTFNCDSK